MFTGRQNVQDNIRLDVMDHPTSLLPAQQTHAPVVDAELVTTTLVALATMARSSQRRQSDVHAAMRRGGISLSAERQKAVLKELQVTGMISQLIPLGDGGLLLTVTHVGMMRAGMGR